MKATGLRLFVATRSELEADGEDRKFIDDKYKLGWGVAVIHEDLRFPEHLFVVLEKFEAPASAPSEGYSIEALCEILGAPLRADDSRRLVWSCAGPEAPADVCIACPVGNHETLLWQLVKVCSRHRAKLETTRPPVWDESLIKVVVEEQPHLGGFPQEWNVAIRATDDRFPGFSFSVLTREGA